MFAFAYAVYSRNQAQPPHIVVGGSGMECVNRIKPYIERLLEDEHKERFGGNAVKTAYEDLKQVGTVAELEVFLSRWLPYRGMLVSDQIK